MAARNARCSLVTSSQMLRANPGSVVRRNSANGSIIFSYALVLASSSLNAFATAWGLSQHICPRIMMSAIMPDAVSIPYLSNSWLRSRYASKPLLPSAASLTVLSASPSQKKCNTRNTYLPMLTMSQSAATAFGGLSAFSSTSSPNFDALISSFSLFMTINTSAKPGQIASSSMSRDPLHSLNLPGSPLNFARPSLSMDKVLILSGLSPKYPGFPEVGGVLMAWRVSSSSILVTVFLVSNRSCEMASSSSSTLLVIVSCASVISRRKMSLSPSASSRKSP